MRSKNIQHQSTNSGNLCKGFSGGRARKALAALALLLSLAAGRASAAVIPLTIEDMVAVSDQIITVRVTETSSAFTNNKIATTAKLQVLDTIKGKATGEQSVTYMGGQYKTLVMNVPDVATLAKGEEAILFLSTPYNRLSAAGQKSFNNASPLVTSPQVVGGWQGKIDLLNPDGTKNSTRKNAEGLPSDVVARRKTTLVDSGPKALGYGALRAEIAELVQVEQQKRAQKATPKSIVGVTGKFYIPEKSTSPEIRAFDPLPSMAYLSDSDLKQLDEAVQKGQKLREEKAAAAKSAAPDAPVQGSSK